MIQKSLLLCGAALLLAGPFRAGGDDLRAGVITDFKTACRRSFELRMKTAEELEKLQYLVPWGVSYDLDAFLDGYLATGDREFLAMFTALAEKAMACRADRLGKTDYLGRLRRGWQASPFYGTGGPLTLLDEDGNPSLEVCTTLLAYNDLTDLTVTVDPARGTFSIETANAKASDRKFCKKHENLTMATVEAAVNTAVTRTDIKVKKVGTKPPAPIGPVRTGVRPFVMHGHHTGKAVVPLLRFALAVRDNPALREAYAETARRYTAFAAEAIDDMDGDWREHPDGGYVVFERGMPFWSDAVPEPNNTLALSGLAYLYLGELTGKPLYRERAAKLASFMRGEIEQGPDGAMFYYWSRVNRLGWDQKAGSVHTPVYVVKRPTVEDNSHLQHSLRFFAVCRRYGVVFTRDDLLRLAEVFHRRIDANATADKPLAERFDGSRHPSRSYQHFQAGWAEFYDVDPAIPRRLREIFLANPPKSQYSSLLSSNAVLLRAEAATATVAKK